jgi:hypothetical protein
MTRDSYFAGKINKFLAKFIFCCSVATVYSPLSFIFATCDCEVRYCYISYTAANRYSATSSKYA